MILDKSFHISECFLIYKMGILPHRVHGKLSKTTNTNKESIMYSAQYTTAVITVINSSTATTQGLFTKFFPTQVNWLPGVIHHCLVCYSVWDSAQEPSSSHLPIALLQ